MNIWVFSRSDGAGSATTRKTRGLTRSVIALMVPPLPAASRPSKMTMTRSPFSFTQAWSAHSFDCRRVSSFAYFFPFSFLWPFSPLFLWPFSSFAMAILALRLPAAAERSVQLGARAQFGAARLCEQQLLLEEVLIRRQDLDVAGKSGVVAI